MPSEIELDFDVMFEAVGRYMEAKAEHDAAYNEYEGYSWGYAGNSYIRRMEEARKEAMESITQSLDSFIIQRVRSALSEAGIKLPEKDE